MNNCSISIFEFRAALLVQFSSVHIFISHKSKHTKKFHYKSIVNVSSINLIQEEFLNSKANDKSPPLNKSLNVGEIFSFQK